MLNTKETSYIFLLLDNKITRFKKEIIKRCKRVIKMWKTNLEARKKEALEAYKKAKKDILTSFDGKKFNDEKFKIFAEAKRNCKLLGVRI